MQLSDFRSHLFSGGAVRQRDWVPEVQLKWDFAKGWMASSDSGKTFEPTSLLPNPLYMFKDDWEALDVG